jgi:hypothetical protein
MNRSRATTRPFATCLLFSGVLILGIVQWSFLPVLIQDSSFSGRTAVEVSPGHSSKFAASFKCLLGDFGDLQPCLKQTSLASPRPPVSFSHPPDVPSFQQDDQFFSYRQLRSPPSA